MTIPASAIVNVNPGVVSTGGNSLAMNGLFITQNTAMPAATTLNFVSADAVSRFFGPASAEAALAAIYFAGYVNASITPGGMLFAPFNVAPRAAFLQSGSLAGMSLLQLQALSGVLTISVDGNTETSSAINLSGATSFSNAATLIQAGFTNPGFTVAWNPVASAFTFTTSATGLTASVSYASGTLAAGLNLTKAAGALLSQGAVADTPATAMANAVANSQNFATFTTLWEPVLGDKEAFTAWTSAQNNRFLYVAWDSDTNASVQGNEASFGAIALQNEYNGVMCIGGDPTLAYAAGVPLASMVLNVAVFAMGAIASINFGQTNGRKAMAFLASPSSAVVPTCASQQTASNLLANGYSFYGSYATANQGFIFLYNGQMTGEFKWVDTYINQIYLNSQLQLALMTLETQAGDIPYNPSGYGMIRNSLMDPISAGINFGSIRTGVTLSATQIAEINQAAGVNAAPQVQTQGFYLQIADPGAQVRGERGSPIINLWYADGDAVQQMSLGSNVVL